MKLVTFIDGRESTPYGVMMDRHSVACSVTIKKEHVQFWESLIRENILYDEPEDHPMYPKDRSAPVPVTFHTDSLHDLVVDEPEELEYAPYYEEIMYMTTQDPVGMGIVYVLP